jgi:hypothetical protein
MHNHDDFSSTQAHYKHEELEEDEDLGEDPDPNEEVLD